MPLLSDVKQNLSSWIDELGGAWSRCRESWLDNRAILFENTVLQPVKGGSRRVLRAIESFEDVLERSRKEAVGMGFRDLYHWESEHCCPS
jgi:hypothetical protein